MLCGSGGISDIVAAVFGEHEMPRWLKSKPRSQWSEFGLDAAGVFRSCLGVCGQLKVSEVALHLGPDVNRDDGGDRHVTLVTQWASPGVFTRHLGREQKYAESFEV